VSAAPHDPTLDALAALVSGARTLPPFALAIFLGLMLIAVGQRLLA